MSGNFAETYSSTCPTLDARNISLYGGGGTSYEHHMLQQKPTCTLTESIPLRNSVF